MPDDPAARHWDAIVIGTGMGGGVVGRALTDKGLSVLFVEKGPAGYRSEETALDAHLFDPVARRIRGYWPDPVTVRVDGVQSQSFLPVGAGVGGSSVFYAATLERPEPHDIDNSPECPHPTGGWPVSFAQMLPWFDAAQAMCHIHGQPDPLSVHPVPQVTPPPPLSLDDRTIMAQFAQMGLHPYRLHSAVRYLPGCTDCIGHKCPRPCKMDGRSAGVEPALASGRAALMDKAEVTRIHATADCVTGIEVQQDGQVIRLTADRYVLAGGALFSPRLLFASANEHWPGGLANRTGQVGRHLMFHLTEMFAYFPGSAVGADAPSKSVGFRDLYHVDGQRLGMVQALGLNAHYNEILHYIRTKLVRRRLTAGRFLHEVARLPALVAARLLGGAKIFVGVIEDLPYPQNRVTADPDQPGRIVIDYTIPAELLARRALFRKRLRQALRGKRILFLMQGPELNYGHPCGTLRMGHDPATSVVDWQCRAHGIANL